MINETDQCSYQVSHLVQVVQSSRVVQVLPEDLRSLELRESLYNLEILGRQARLGRQVHLYERTRQRMHYIDY